MQRQIIIILHRQMGDPVKYLTLVTEVLELYQQELLAHFKKMPGKDLKKFMKKITQQISILRATEDEKGIHQARVSQKCQPMLQYLNISTRPAATSQSQRYAIRASLMSQEGTRMRFTGGLKKNPNIGASIGEHNNTIEESQGQIQDIIHSYRIQDELVPRMRMKWKSFKHQQMAKPYEEQNKNSNRKQRATIGDNNIDLLSYTIPEIENSIKRLSLHSRDFRNRTPDRGLESYRTIDTRAHNRKKYVNRLI